MDIDLESVGQLYFHIFSALIKYSFGLKKWEITMSFKVLLVAKVFGMSLEKSDESKNLYYAIFWTVLYGIWKKIQNDPNVEIDAKFE